MFLIYRMNTQTYIEQVHSIQSLHILPISNSIFTSNINIKCYTATKDIYKKKKQPLKSKIQNIKAFYKNLVKPQDVGRDIFCWSREVTANESQEIVLFSFLGVCFSTQLLVKFEIVEQRFFIDLQWEPVYTFTNVSFYHNLSILKCLLNQIQP